MKLQFALALSAAALLAGCSKCSQQPTPDVAPIESADPSAVEGATGDLPTEPIGEELPPETEGTGR